MVDDSLTPKAKLSWFERLSLVLLGEPKNRDELVTLLRDAQRREVLDSDALSMIEGAMSVSEMRVDDVMIPRGQMVVLHRDMDLEAILPILVDSAHSRFPVTGDDPEEIVGLVLAKDFLKWLYHTDKPAFHLRNLLRPVRFVPKNKRLDTLLNDFRRSRSHMAMVVDEYGHTVGLVTIEDVLEQIVGDIADEHDVDTDEQPIREHDDGHYMVKALTPIDEFLEIFEVDLPETDVDTVGGLVLKHFGRLPKTGDAITIGSWQCVVRRADNRRLHLLEFTPLSDGPSSGSA